MADFEALQQLREQRYFSGWNEFISRERVEASESSVRRLINDLLALGPQPNEADARRAVNECVLRFNNMDDGWICTIEREDICEQIGRAVNACGFDSQEDWFDEREW